MNVLVTGASGFLGVRVVSELLERGHGVRALIRPATGAPAAEWGDRAQIVRADLRTARGLEGLCDGIDVVVHLAAQVRGTPEAQFAGTVSATEHLLAEMHRAHSPRRLVLASSYSVYDWSVRRRRLDEETPVDPRPFERDGYAVAKIWQERVVRRFAAENGCALAVLRPGFIVAPGTAPISGAGLRIGRALVVVGPFTRLPLTGVHACARAFADAAEKGVEGTFNIIDDEETSGWRYAGSLLKSGAVSLRMPFPYLAGLALAYAATAASRLLFPPTGGKLPGVLMPRRYRARFRPLEFSNERAKSVLGWSGGAVPRETPPNRPGTAPPR